MLPLLALAAVADFDGDHLVDIAYAAVESPPPVCQKTHDGTSCYTPGQSLVREVVRVHLGRDHGALSQTLVVATHRYDEERAIVGYLERVGAVGDLDGDGKSELGLQWDRAGKEQLLLVRGATGGLASAPYQRVDLPRQASAQWYNLPLAPAGDLDADGRADVAFGNAILRGTGKGTLGPPELVTPTAGFTYVHPAGDVDGDGKADLVAVGAEWDGTPPHAWLVRGGAKLASTPLAIDHIMAVADLDGDGRAELVATAGARVATYGWTRGVPAVRSSVEIGGAVHQIAASGGDVVVVTSTRTEEIICNTRCFGPAGFALQVIRGGTLASTITEANDAWPRVLASGDFDGDKRVDLIVELGRRIVIHQSKLGDVAITPP